MLQLRTLLAICCLCWTPTKCESPDIQSDVIIGGIFPVTRKENNGSVEYTSVNDRGIQRLEAMFFAIDKLNREKFIPGIQFRAEIVDSVNNADIALKRSMKFIETSAKQNKSSKFIGVVGASNSSITSKITQLLQLFHIPMISYASTDSSLSDKQRYSMFARTVSSDLTQALIMASIAKHYNWSYVSVVYSEATKIIASKFVSQLKNYDKCAAIYEQLQSNPSEKDCNEILKSLLSRSRTSAVFVFLNNKDFMCILNANRNLRTKQFVWITSYFSEAPVIYGLSDDDAVISIEAKHEYAKEFDDYFTKLGFNARNAWFEEYLENKPKQHTQEPKVVNVINAVYAFAYAFKNAWKVLCSGKPGMCEQLSKLSGEEFFVNYVWTVNFADINGKMIEFNGNEVIQTYDIMQISNEFNVLLTIGLWGKNGLNITGDKWKNGIPESICSSPCRKGMRRLFQEGDKCCWICAPCGPNEYIVDEYTCKKCAPGYKPSADQSGCELDQSSSNIPGSKNDGGIESGSCSKEMNQLKCRLSHLEHNLLPLKYEFPRCKYND